jgi:ABC-type nitrate/sulfonate/bicarbonate transport system ATPase subunit
MDSCNPSNVRSTTGDAEAAPVLRIRIERKTFADPVSARDRLILDGVAFSVQAGEFLALVGPSGCGKSTLLQLIAGLDRDFSGAVEWPGADTRARPRLGYCFQNPRLLPWLSLRGNIDLMLDDPAAAAVRVDGLLAAMGLGEVGHFPANRLSIGMQRRTALARAFAVRPRLLLMDEPFVSLDAPTAAQLRGLLLDLCVRERPTVCFVTHDLCEATQLADRVLFLSGPPTRIVGTAAVPVPRAERQDPRPVAAACADLQDLFLKLYGNSDH